MATIRRIIKDRRRAKIEPRCPGSKASPTQRQRSGTIHGGRIVRTGAPRRSMPLACGNWNAVCRRFLDRDLDRAKAGIFESMFNGLSDTPGP